MSREKMINKEISKLVVSCLDSSYKKYSEVISEKERNRLLCYYGGKIIDIMLNIPEENVNQILYDSIEQGYEEFTRGIYDTVNEFAVYPIQQTINNLECDIVLFFNKRRYSKTVYRALLDDYARRL